MFTVEILDADLRGDISAALREIVTGIREGVIRGTAEGAAEARAVARFKDHSGAQGLRASIHAEHTQPAVGGAEGVIVADKTYASYVEHGTSAHDIYPKAGHGEVGALRKGQSRRKKKDGPARRVLRFVIGGRVFYRAKVHHPVGRSHPFMGPAYLKCEAVIEREVMLSVERAQRMLDR